MKPGGIALRLSLLLVAFSVFAAGLASHYTFVSSRAMMTERAERYLLSTTEVLARPGWLLGGQIARLVDKGYQKFLKTPKMEIPATADHLRAIHEFSEELKEAAGATSLYNESLGTTSDRYVYDRVKGRE